MKTSWILAGAIALAGVAAAQASVAMSFADPIPGRQLSNLANGAGAGVGLLRYDQTVPLTFLFDGAGGGFVDHVFTDARMELTMSLGAATTIAGVTTAPVSGSFTIFDMSSGMRRDIVTGTAAAGTFVRISNTNSLLFSDPTFSYAAGPALVDIVGPITFLDPSEGVLTLTSVVTDGGGSFINPDGTFKSFEANASFTGNAEAVPAPGAIALAGLGALCVARRRRA
ncbi:MAG: PEP-CTERM sorting domain-containing protein [Planctomycetota bacterium]|nr:PEP-CTERM sorting domain-containing protein [Planctomycetota bacterium]